MKYFTLPETNVAPKNGCLEDDFPIGEAYFQGRTVSFREGDLARFMLDEMNPIEHCNWTLTI